MSEWISVEDRLPEYQGRAGSTRFAHVIGNDAVLGPGEVMYSEGVWTGIGGVTLNVTHWMPLPAPPKVEE